MAGISSLFYNKALKTQYVSFSLPPETMSKNPTIKFML